MTHIDSAAAPPNSKGIIARVRPALEVLALTMIVAVCGAMLVAIVRGTWILAPAGPARAAGQAARARPEPALPSDPLSLDGAQVLGAQSAPVAVIEYSDFQCPYCGRFARDTFPTINKDYVQSGKALFAFREFPLESIHKFALQAAEAAECAGDQGQFWKMHDLNFADQSHLEAPALEARAKAGALNLQKFSTCLSAGAADKARKIKADETTGETLAVSGTPTFFIGLRQADGRVKVMRRLSGAVPAANFGAEIDAVLKASETKVGKVGTK